MGSKKGRGTRMPIDLATIIMFIRVTAFCELYATVVVTPTT